MTDQEIRTFPCELCGSDDLAEIEVLRLYRATQPIMVCRHCGFVQVNRRRAAAAIADTWSNEIYGKNYTARIPAVKARQVYVLDTIDVWFGLRGKHLCDIGAGEGQLLEIGRGPDYGALAFGIEPSAANCNAMTRNGIDAFHGTIEDFQKEPRFADRRFDIATITWTLENCFSCVDMLRAARKLLKPDGHLVVATGSRILVPFRKPMQYYIARDETDTHPYRYSRNSLARALTVAGFDVVRENRYIDTDYLVLAGAKREGPLPADDALPRDDWKAVIKFFERWHEDTSRYYAGL